MWCDAMRCDEMRSDEMRCDAMRCHAMRCDAMRCDAMRMQCNAMRCNAMQCDSMRCNAMQCNAMSCNVMQCNVIYCNVMSCNVMEWNVMDITMELISSSKFTGFIHLLECQSSHRCHNQMNPYPVTDQYGGGGLSPLHKLKELGFICIYFWKIEFIFFGYSTIGYILFLHSHKIELEVKSVWFDTKKLPLGLYIMFSFWELLKNYLTYLLTYLGSN